MSFKEATRITAHDGSVHVHSEAYEAVKAFLQQYNLAKEIKDEIDLLRQQIQDRAPELKQAAEEMFAALHDHYDGRIPEYVEFSSAILRLDEDGDVQVIRPASYCDLYRIERTEDKAA